MTRIIVAGSRNFADKEMLYMALSAFIDAVDDEVEIVDGACRGADKLAEEYASEFGYKNTTFPADWDKYGKRAGYIRNTQMAEYAVKADDALLIAFPVGESRGTNMMIDIAKKHEIMTYVCGEYVVKNGN